MHRQRRSASLRQLPLNAFTGVQLCDGREKALGVGGGTQEVGGFLQRLVVFERKHHDGLFSIAGNDQGFVVVANAVRSQLFD